MNRTARLLTGPATLLALLGALLIALSACSSSAPSTGAGPRAAQAAPSLVATPAGESVAVYATQAAATPQQVLAKDLPEGTPRSFLVVEDRGPWLRALLPDGPNGATAWLRRTDVNLAPDDFAVDVSVTDRRLTVRRASQTVLTTPVAVGAPSTPTPTGSFFITELLQPSNPDGAYGPYAFGLSGHSQVLHDFAGGDGQIGLHGTSDPGSIGQAVSHGCIRVPNDTITQLAQLLPLGTPVSVHA